jgi:hypothetical protein
VNGTDVEGTARAARRIVAAVAATMRDGVDRVRRQVEDAPPR